MGVFRSRPSASIRLTSVKACICLAMARLARVPPKVHRRAPIASFLVIDKTDATPDSGMRSTTCSISSRARFEITVWPSAPWRIARKIPWAISRLKVRPLPVQRALPPSFAGSSHTVCRFQSTSVMRQLFPDSRINRSSFSPANIIGSMKPTSTLPKATQKQLGAGERCEQVFVVSPSEMFFSRGSNLQNFVSLHQKVELHHVRD